MAFTPRQAITPTCRTADSQQKYFGTPQSGHPAEDMRHDRSMCQKINLQRSHFVVNPEWVSEEFTAPKFKGRSHRPWPFEFPGARNWPMETGDDCKLVNTNPYQHPLPTHPEPGSNNGGAANVQVNDVTRDLTKMSATGLGPHSAHMYHDEKANYTFHPTFAEYYAQYRVAQDKPVSEVASAAGLPRVPTTPWRPSAGLSPRRAGNATTPGLSMFSRHNLI